MIPSHNTDVLFSHRGHNGKRGNLGAFLSNCINGTIELKIFGRCLQICTNIVKSSDKGEKYE